MRGGGWGDVVPMGTVPTLEARRPTLKNLDLPLLQSLLLPRPCHLCPLHHPLDLPCHSTSLALLITSPPELGAFTTPYFFLPDGRERPASLCAGMKLPDWPCFPTVTGWSWSWRHSLNQGGTYWKSFSYPCGCPNPSRHSAYFEINECATWGMQASVIKPRSHCALPLNLCLEHFSECEAVTGQLVDSPWLGRPPFVTEDR